MPSVITAVQTYGWRSYLIECAWYWALMSFVHAGLFLVGIALVAAASYYWRGHFRLWARRWTLFNLCLFFTSGLVNGLWSCFVFGRFYWSTDYVFDFSPFRPISQQVLDARFGDKVGGLLGISLLQLQALWLAFALGAWTTAFALYRFCRPSSRSIRLSTNASNPTMRRTADGSAARQRDNYEG